MIKRFSLAQMHSWFKILLISLTLCTITFAHAQTKITIALARNTITPAEEIFSFAVPAQLGYFAAEDIAPFIIKTNGSIAALQAVASGNADIGFASSVSIAAAIENGMPIKAFAGLTIRWPYDTAVLPNSPILTFTDLHGKRVGVISLASASYADLKANLYYAGMSEQDITIIPVGTGIQAALALQNRQVDAIVSYSDSFALMHQNGFDFTLLPRIEQMEQLFSVTMFTSEKMLQENPELLIRFARAAYKGIIYTHLYPDHALALGFKEFPELAGSENPQGADAQNTQQTMLIALGDSIPANQPDPTTWGQWLNIGSPRWQALLEFSYKTGQTETLLKPEQVWDGSLMNAIYNFDAKDIVQQP